MYARLSETPRPHVSHEKISSLLLLQRTFSLCVKQTNLDSCKDAIRSARKEDSSILSTDTDVVVLAISIFEKLVKDKLWIAFGKGKYRQWIPIHGVSISLGPRALGRQFYLVLIYSQKIVP
jgi:hypothetical protein